MNKKIKPLIGSAKNVPASVYHCDIIAFDDEIKHLPSVKLVTSKHFYTYKLYIEILGKPISRIL